jgi:hypothetical protein
MEMSDELQQQLRIMLYTLAGGLLTKAGLDAALVGPAIDVFMWAGAGLVTWVGTFTWWKFWDKKRVEAPTVPAEPAV